VTLTLWCVVSLRVTGISEVSAYDSLVTQQSISELSIKDEAIRQQTLSYHW